MTWTEHWPRLNLHYRNSYYYYYYYYYLVTQWCRVLLEKLAVSKGIPRISRNPKVITALTSVRHLSLSWARPIQSTYPHPTSWRSTLILSTNLRLGLPSGLFPSGFPTKTPYTPSPPPYAPHAQPISFFSILSPAQYWVRSTNHLAPRYAISSIPPLPRPSSVQIFSSTPYSQTPSASFLSSRNVNDQVSHLYKTTGKFIVLYILIFKFLDSNLEDKRFYTEW